MPKDNSPRSRFRRILKEQCIRDLNKIQSQVMNFLPDYAEGSDSNIRIAAKLEVLYNIIEETKTAILLILEDL